MLARSAHSDRGARADRVCMCADGIIVALPRSSPPSRTRGAARKTRADARALSARPALALRARPRDRARRSTFAALDRAAQFGVAQAFARRAPRDRRSTVMGITFPNRVGLAAGLDKNAAHLAGLATFGFGFIEAGTVTPRAAARQSEAAHVPAAARRSALINRLGFNNGGVDGVRRQRRAHRATAASSASTSARTSTRRTSAPPTTTSRACAPCTARAATSPSTSRRRTRRACATCSRRTRSPRCSRALDARAAGARAEARPARAARRQDRARPRRTTRCAASRGCWSRTASTASSRPTRRSRATRVAGLPHAEEAGGLSGAPLRDRVDGGRAHARRRRCDGALPIIGVGGIAVAARTRARRSPPARRSCRSTRDSSTAGRRSSRSASGAGALTPGVRRRVRFASHALRSRARASLTLARRATVIVPVAAW